MIKLVEVLKRFDLNVSKTKLKDEIIDLAKNWDVIKKGCSEDYEVFIVETEEYSYSNNKAELHEHDTEMVGEVGSKVHKEHGKNCPGVFTYCYKNTTCSQTLTAQLGWHINIY